MMARRLLIASLMFALACQASGAKLIEQKPLFDTSYLPKKRSPFKLELKHTAIVYPENPEYVLHGRTGVFDLRGQHEETKLRGQVSTAVLNSSINTLQRGITSGQFHLDLFTLVPKIAPDLSRQLAAQIDQSNQRLAAHAEDEKAMQQQLQKPRMAPVIPAGVIAKNDPNLSAQIDNANPKPNPLKGLTGAEQMQAEIQRAKLAMGAATMPARGGFGGGSMPPGGGGGGGGVMPPFDGVGGVTMPPGAGTSTPVVMPSHNPSLTQAEREMQAQLDAAKKRPLVETDVDAALRAANARANLIGKNATPLLAAPSVNGRILPGAGGNSATSATATSIDLFGKLTKTIDWDPWHRNFAATAGGAMLKAVNKVGDPVGSNTVEVTVWPDRRLDVRLTTPRKSKFDDAVLQAYRTLSGNAALAFPRGSLRSSVSFLVDNKHGIDGVATVVDSKTTSGDKEVQQQGR